MPCAIVCEPPLPLSLFDKQGRFSTLHGMSQRSIFALAVLICIMGLAGIGLAQDEPTPTVGAGPFQLSDTRQYDSINLYNLGVSIDIPIVNKPGIMPFSYDLIQQSDAGFPLTGMYSHQATVINSGYWYWFDNQGVVAGETNVSYLWDDYNNLQDCVGTLEIQTNNDQPIPGVEVSFLTVVDASGGQHIIWAQGSTLAKPVAFKLCVPAGQTATATGLTLDWSGYTISVTVNAATHVVSYTLTDTLHGYTIQNPYANVGSTLPQPSSNTITITDPNNNKLTAATTYPSSNGPGTQTVTTWKDATNSTVLVVTSDWWSSPCQCPVYPSGYSPTTFTYYDANNNPQTYTANYNTFVVSPNWSPNLALVLQLPASISVPDGSLFNFTYNSTTGLLTSLTTPSQETISYSEQYSPTYAGWVVQRTDADGTWTYVGGASSGNSPLVGSVALSPKGDTTAYTGGLFVGSQASVDNIIIPDVQLYVPLEITQYSGNSLAGSGSIIKQTQVCYNNSSCFASTGCGDDGCYPILSQYAYTTLAGMTTSSLSLKTYDAAYERQLSDAEYDFGPTTSPFGMLISETSYQYGTYSSGTCSTISATINDRVCTVQTENGAGKVLSQTNNTYDSHGNVVSVSQLVTGSTYLKESFTHTANGTVSSVTDVNGAVTTVVNAACNNTLPTKITSGGLSKSFTWNCTTAEIASTTDANSGLTSYVYNDPLWGITSVTDPIEVVTNYSYGKGRSYVEKSLSFNGGNSILDTRTTMDVAGRPHVIQVSEGPGSGKYDTTTTTYDSNGRTYFTSLPCVQNAWGTGCTGSSGMLYSYDPLNRTTNTSDTAQPTSGQTIQSYIQNDVLTVSSPATSGENLKQKQAEYDGLGRLTSLCEITTASNGLTCQQNSSQTGYWTRYKYDALGHVIGVCQYTTEPLTTDCTITPSSGQQTRLYTYDGLGRLISENNPESGTTTYTYDVVAANYCGSSAAYSSAGDLVATADANGNHICYQYDPFHRLTVVSNNAPSSTNYCKRFLYDNSSGVLGTIPLGVTVNNGLGRLVEAETDTCASPITQSSMITDEWFSYDKDGRITDMWELTPHSGQYYHSIATFYGNGEVNSIQLAGPSLYTMSWTIDGEGRWKTLTDTTSSQSLVTGATYYPDANPMVVSLTGTDKDSYTIDTNTGRMTKFVFTIGNTPSSLTGNLTWNPNGTLSQLGITDGFNAGGTQTCNYNPTAAKGTGYDDLARLIGFDCGSGQWGQTFSFDPFGNLTKTPMSNRSGTTWSPGYNESNNHCNGCSYDSDGNVDSDGTNNYGWNVYSKIAWTMASPGTASCGTSGRCAVYDAFGRIVEQTIGSTFRERWITQLGETAYMTGTSPIFAYWPAPGGGTVLLYGNSTNYDYLHPDWLDTARIDSSLTSNTVTTDQAYSPYGELYDIFGSNVGQNEVFGGLTGLFAPGTTTPIMWDTPNRELSMVGRWLSPDPAGIGAADPSNPQSWNRYAYMNGNPLSGTDPSGLDGCSDVSISSDGSGSAACDLSTDNSDSDSDSSNWNIVGTPFGTSSIVPDPWFGHPYAQQVFSQPVLAQAAQTMNAVTAVYGVGFGAAGAIATGSALGVGALAKGVASAGYGYYLIYGAPLATSIACAELCNGMSPFPTLAADSSVAMSEAEGGLIPEANAQVAELGNKLNYLLGKSGGDNASRSVSMAKELEAIGISDSPAARQYLTEHLNQVLADPNNIVKELQNGNVMRESLLMGPLGGLKLITVWSGKRVMTFGINELKLK